VKLWRGGDGQGIDWGVPQEIVKAGEDLRPPAKEIVGKLGELLGIRFVRVARGDKVETQAASAFELVQAADMPAAHYAAASEGKGETHRARLLAVSV
jgi:hypothetical protein